MKKKTAQKKKYLKNKNHLKSKSSRGKNFLSILLTSIGLTILLMIPLVKFANSTNQLVLGIATVNHDARIIKNSKPTLPAQTNLCFRKIECQKFPQIFCKNDKCPTITPPPCHTVIICPKPSTTPTPHLTPRATSLKLTVTPNPTCIIHPTCTPGNRCPEYISHCF